MNFRKLFLSLTLPMFLPFAAAQAATWHVDAAGTAGAIPSLQEALDRAADGDEILVADGEYGPVSLSSSKSLLVRSAGGAENAVISGGGTGRCATLCDGNGVAARLVTLEGFTLSGGVDASDAGGGGVLGGNLANCILRDNVAVRGGGASGARLENCLVTGNGADVAGGGAAGSELVNCTVAGNRAGGTGGGVSGCTLANSIVQANESPDGADAVATLAVFSCTTPLLEGEGNTGGDPRFADPSAGDWRLSGDSPCLDAGNGGFCTGALDVAGNGRLAGDAVDLGAYEGAASPRSPTAKNANTVTITFDPNGGTITRNQMTFLVGEHYSGFPLPVRPGYVYTGWFTAPSGGTHITGKIAASPSHKVFYAQWAPTVTITFDPNGGTITRNQMTFRVGEKYSGFPLPVRPGHVYTGWFTAPSGGTHITGKISASASHKVFYAQWVPTVTITFDPNGGTVTRNQMTFRVGEKYSGFPVPVRPGYMRLGWFTAPSGGTQITGKIAASPSHERFYAQWVRAVTVTFDPNGGTCATSQKEYAVGSPYASLPTPSRTDWAFDGWYTPGGVRVTAASTATLAQTRLVAHWKRKFSVHSVGDSMTYGIRTRTNPLSSRGNKASVVAQISNQGWRGYLKQSLSSWGSGKNYAVEFRGTHPESSYAGNVPHDGYCGERASSYVSRHKSAFSVKANVHVVFLGMNDALAISLKGGNPGNYFSGTRDGYARVLSSLNAGTTPQLTVLVTEPAVTSLVSSHNSSYSASAINRVITGWINPYIRSRAGAKVKVLDIQSLYSSSSRTDDGFHLSVTGNREIAARLESLIESFWQ